LVTELKVDSFFASCSAKYGESSLKEFPSREELISKLEQRADRMFQYVILVVGAISQLVEDALPFKEISSSLVKRITDVFTLMPEQVWGSYALYLQVLDPNEVSVAFRIRSLKLIVAAKSPLSIPSFCELVGLQEDRKELQKQFGLLVELDAPGGLVLCHRTFKEFLLGSQPIDENFVKVGEQYRFSACRAHTEMAIACFDTLGKLEQYPASKDDAASSPIVKYAVKYWSYHCLRASAAPPQSSNPDEKASNGLPDEHVESDLIKAGDKHLGWLKKLFSSEQVKPAVQRVGADATALMDNLTRGKWVQSSPSSLSAKTGELTPNDVFSFLELDVHEAFAILQRTAFNNETQPAVVLLGAALQASIIAAVSQLLSHPDTNLQLGSATEKMLVCPVYALSEPFWVSQMPYLECPSYLRNSLQGFCDTVFAKYLCVNANPRAPELMQPHCDQFNTSTASS
jgi:hypothetical protein